MGQTPKERTRKGNPPIKVYCLPSERRQIEVSAKRAGLSASAYLLSVGMGYQPPGVMDAEHVRTLVKINGDLGRLGGLLKLWLTDDVRTRHYEPSLIRAVLSRIEASQDIISDVAWRVVRPRADSRF